MQMHPSTNFDRSVRSISTGGQIVPTTLLLTPPTFLRPWASLCKSDDQCCHRHLLVDAYLHMIWTCGNRSFPDRSPKFSIKLVHNRSNIEFILQVNRFTNAAHWVEILSIQYYDSCSTGCYLVTLLLLQPRCLFFFPGWNVILPWEGMMYLQDRWPSRWWFSCRASTGRWPKCAPKLLSPKISTLFWHMFAFYTEGKFDQTLFTFQLIKSHSRTILQLV